MKLLQVYFPFSSGTKVCCSETDFSFFLIRALSYFLKADSMCFRLIFLFFSIEMVIDISILFKLGTDLVNAYICERHRGLHVYK